MNLNKYLKDGYIVSPLVDEDEINYYKKVKLYELKEKEIKELFFSSDFYDDNNKYYDYKYLILIKCLDRVKITPNDLLMQLETFLKIGNYNFRNIRTILDIFNLKDNKGYIFYPHIDEEYYKNDILMCNDYLFDNDEHIISYVCNKISNLDKEDCLKDLEQYIAFIKEVIEERNKNKEERKYSKDTLSLILDSLFIASNYDKDLSEEANIFYKEHIFKSADEDKDPISIRNLGYDFYEGLNGLPLNYDKSLEYLLKYYEISKDSDVTRAIGYIYYYGRCNNGIIEKDKAFQYFALGHFTKGYFESTYKLADCYMHGYGTPISYEASYNLVKKIYWPTKNYFLKGEDSKFADVALRMGKFYRDSIYVEKDLNKSLKYFLESRCAIKERIKNINYIGDKKVAIQINESINDLNEELNISPRVIKYGGFVVKKINASFEYDIIKIDFLDGFIHIYITKDNDDEDNYFINNIPSISFCERSNLIEFLIKSNNYESTIEFTKLVNSNKIIRLDINSDVLSFVIEGKKYNKNVSLEIDELIMIPQSIKDINKKYKIVGVEFYPNSKLYEYLSLNNENDLGDKVKVLSNNEIKEVTIKEIKYLYEDELPLPLSKMSKIL